ncbi:MAG: hypothetical protein Fur0014_12870 [Rubrivivax sp.]
MRREWLQHRLGWALMAGLPTALAVLGFGVGELHFDESGPPGHLPSLIALASLGGAIGLHLAIFVITGLIIVTGLARRDHGDRSIEFWLSLPTGHAESLAVPLGVHLLVAPLAGLLVGLASGLVVSLVLVLRVAGFGEWLALPWGLLLGGALTVAARLTLGLVLALLWVAPLMLAVVLLTAWFRRWGLVIGAVGIGLGSAVLDRLFGQPFLAQWLGAVLVNAGRSLGNTGSQPVTVEGAESLPLVLDALGRWALADAAAAVRLAGSPMLLGGLVLAAALFWALVQWRRRGAGA